MKCEETKASDSLIDSCQPAIIIITSVSSDSLLFVNKLERIMCERWRILRQLVYCSECPVHSVSAISSRHNFTRQHHLERILCRSITETRLILSTVSVIVESTFFSCYTTKTHQTMASSFIAAIETRQAFTCNNGNNEEEKLCLSAISTRNKLFAEMISMNWRWWRQRGMQRQSKSQ